jgi:hypothetical protein
VLIPFREFQEILGERKAKHGARPGGRHRHITGRAHQDRSLAPRASAWGVSAQAGAARRAGLFARGRWETFGGSGARRALLLRPDDGKLWTRAACRTWVCCYATAVIRSCGSVGHVRGGDAHHAGTGPPNALDVRSLQHQLAGRCHGLA